MFLYERQRSQILHSDKKYKQSLDYSLRSLKKVNEKGAKEELIEVYRLIAGNYREIGDKEKSNHYMVKYDLLRDSLSNTRKEGIIVSSDYLTSKQNENELRTEKVRDGYVISGTVVAFILSSLAVIMIARYRKRQKELSLRLQFKNQKLLEKDLEKIELEKKLNDSFEGVTQLAKENSSSFFARFQETYPFYTPQLLNLESKLQASELTFCAYIFLNFSTKEIAAYTFTSVKTVQNRKNHIRKKLLIPSDKDIYVWMKETVTA